MSIRISCPACKAVLAVNDEVRGSKIRCTGCGAMLAVPAVGRGGPPAGAAVKPAVPAAPPPAATAPPPNRQIESAAAAAIPQAASAVPVPPPAPPAAAAIQKLSPESAAPDVARAAFADLTPPPAEAKTAQKTKPAKSKLPIVLLLAGGGAALVLFGVICAGSSAVYLIFVRQEARREADHPQAQKTVKIKEERKADPVPPPEPIVDPNAGKPLPAQMPADIREQVKAATVYLRVTRPGGGVMQGSGFFAVQPGIVVTNAHVLGMLHAGSQAPIEVEATLNSGQANEVKLDGIVLGVDRQTDLGIVRIGESPFLPRPLFLETERKPFETQEVYIFGFPFGEQLGANITVSKSAVSSLRKNPASDELKEIQVNGGMHPGNSGGPVVNSFGNVVGVAVSVIRGTTINFAVPAEKVRRIMDGRLAETTIGAAYLQGGQAHLPVRMTCLDPLNRVRALRVEVWTGAPGAAAGGGANEPRPPAPGDGQRQTHKISYRDGVGALDVPLPPLPPGKIYWIQPSVVAGGGTQWEAARPLAGPFYPLERKPAPLVVSLTAQKECTVKLKSSQSVTAFKGKDKKIGAYQIEADLLEVLSPHPKGALKRIAFGPVVASSDANGKVTNDAQVANVLRQIPPTFVIDAANKMQTRSDRGLNPRMPANLREDVTEAYAQFCNSMEAVTMPMPNRTLEPLESWPTQIPLLLRDGPRAEVVDLALDCTYEGTRLRDQRREAFITLKGIVKGRGKNINKVGGNVTGKLAFDLAGGYIAQAVFKISSDYDVQGVQITDALDIHLDRAPGNPLNIPAPTPFKPAPGPGVVLEGKIILKIDGSLAATDPLFPKADFQPKNARMKTHQVTLQAGKTYAIALNSKAFDSYLVLASPQGKVLAEDDDSGGSLNALIIHTPAASGLYRITATAFDGQLGAYQLTVLELAAEKK